MIKYYEVIPKIKPMFAFSEEHILKHNNKNPVNRINLIKFEKMFIVETAYSYAKFTDYNKANEVYNEWVEDAQKISESMRK